MKQALDLEKIKQSANQASSWSENRKNAFLRIVSEELSHKRLEIIKANKNDLIKA